MDSYHGTSASDAKVLAGGGVDVKMGGGELGRGFYTGQHLHEAKAWAFHRTGDRQRNVVQFDVAAAAVDKLNFDILDYGTAGLRRHLIKKLGQTRTYLFWLDMVWAPIVGSERASGDQYKWESADAQDLLNAKTTKKLIV